eukprot:4192413-Pyramimonas_sp.AAC.1
MGLRSSTNTAKAAYWASWADVLQQLTIRFPDVARNIVYRLTTLQAGGHGGPECLVATEAAGHQCDAAGWRDRPTWPDLPGGR